MAGAQQTLSLLISSLTNIRLTGRHDVDKLKDYEVIRWDGYTVFTATSYPRYGIKRVARYLPSTIPPKEEEKEEDHK